MRRSLSQYRLEDVFVTEGVPEFTFVKPPNYNEIFIDVRRVGKPVILEGQSGTGKTTCIKQILAQMEGHIEAEYLSARRPEDVAQIKTVIEKGLEGHYVIDDFHRLDDDLKEKIAHTAKLAAEQGSDSKLPKLIIIGINQVGSDLIQLVPDIAKRTGVHRISPGSPEGIQQLIENGANKLNVVIENVDNIFEETKGDYWLTQQLCQSICNAYGVTETQQEKITLDFDLTDIRSAVVTRLKAAYYPPVKEFCRGTRFRPQNDPYYKLLNAVAQGAESAVDLNGLANSNADARGSINNIKAKRLRILLDTKIDLANYFFYNVETRNFAIEDPALFYFLQHLDWDDLRKDCGFRESHDDFEYEVALSFAGENRDLAAYIDARLTELDVSVFYDRNFEANFLGSVWSQQFSEIFGHKSRFIVCLLDKNHSEKIWPTFEREHFQPRVGEGSVIPIYLDETKFVGIPRDLVGIPFHVESDVDDWEDQVDAQIVERLLDKLCAD